MWNCKELSLKLDLDQLQRHYEQHCERLDQHVADTITMLEAKVGLEERIILLLLWKRGIHPWPNEGPVKVLVDWKQGTQPMTIERIGPSWERDRCLIYLRGFTKKGTPRKTGLHGYPMQVVQQMRPLPRKD